jgi:predicted nucleic acid-binding protein
MPDLLICVDASIVVRLVTDPADDRLLMQWQKWLAEGARLAAPALLFFEVSNALYQYQRHGYLSTEAVEQALNATLALPIQLHVDPVLHVLAMRMARRFDLAATYDAHYLVLADHLGAELWTVDRRLAERVRPKLAWVRLYS